MTSGMLPSDPQLGQAPRRRRRVLLISLGALCLIVVGALAIGFGIKGKDNDKSISTHGNKHGPATEAVSSMADTKNTIVPSAPESGTCEGVKLRKDQS